MLFMCRMLLEIAEQSSSIGTVLLFFSILSFFEKNDILLVYNGYLITLHVTENCIYSIKIRIRQRNGSNE